MLKTITTLFTLYFGELPVAEPFSGELTKCAAAPSLPHGHHAWLRDSPARAVCGVYYKHATPAGRRLLREGAYYVGSHEHMTFAEVRV